MIKSIILGRIMLWQYTSRILRINNIELTLNKFLFCNRLLIFENSNKSCKYIKFELKVVFSSSLIQRWQGNLINHINRWLGKGGKLADIPLDQLKLKFNRNSQESLICYTRRFSLMNLVSENIPNLYFEQFWMMFYSLETQTNTKS